MKTLLSALILLAASTIAFAQTSSVPPLMSYQGHVTDVSGTPIGSGNPVNRTVIFKLYDTSSGGAPLYAEEQVVTIADGNFSVLIGNGTGVAGLPGPSAPAIPPFLTLPPLFEGDLYLGVTVDDGSGGESPEIAPRQRIVSAAYSFRAGVAERLVDGALQTGMLADASVTTNKIGASQVTTAKIANANIVTAHIADANITTGKLADGSVTTAKLANNAVTTAKIANNSVTLDKLDTSGFGVWTPNGTHVYRSAGNVGIGQSSPGFPLNFASDHGNKISLSGNSGNHYGIGTRTNMIQIHTPNDAGGTAFGYGSSTNFSETARITGNTSEATLSATGKLHLRSGGGSPALTIDSANRIGIGRTDPLYPLHFPNTLGNKIALHGNSGNHYGFGIQGSLLQIYTGSSSADIAFGYGSSESFAERMRVKGDGRVTIGTNSTKAKLNVGNIITSWETYGRLTTDGATGNNTNRNNEELSIYANGQMLADQYHINSDARIKTAIHRSENAKDLDTLSRIEISDYQYKDWRHSGTGTEKKVIAQQLEEVFPQAVTQRTGVIPDIYQNATAENGWILLATDLQTGDRVRLIHPVGESLHDVLETRPNAFRVDLDPSVTEVFVYGREVSDFRTVDYDAIAMLNVSATQELHRRVANLEEVVASQNDTIDDLVKRLAALEKLLGNDK